MYRGPFALLFAVAQAATPTGQARAQAAPALRATGKLIIQIGDTATRPLEGAEVLIPTVGFVWRVGKAGEVLVSDVPTGRHVVSARRLGFRAETQVISLDSGETKTLAFYLEPSSKELPTFVVRGQRAPVDLRMAEFEHRRATGIGSFISRADIEREHPAQLRDMVAQLPGMTIVPTDRGNSQVRVRRANLQTDWDRMGDCRPAYYVDGMPIPPSVTVPPVPGRGGASIDLPRTAEITIDDFRPNEVEGIEVYTSPAKVPAQYLANKAECGVILIWTQTGAYR